MTKIGTQEGLDDAICVPAEAGVSFENGIVAGDQSIERAMIRNPVFGIIFGVLAIAFSVFSMTTRSETPPPGYALLDYGIIALGAVALIGSLVAYAKNRKN